MASLALVRDDIGFDLCRLSRSVGAQLVVGKAVDLDQDNTRVLLENGSTLSFDVGVTAGMYRLACFGSLGAPAKPLPTFAQG